MAADDFLVHHNEVKVWINFNLRRFIRIERSGHHAEIPGHDTPHLKVELLVEVARDEIELINQLTICERARDLKLIAHVVD